jgi:hypothetical protein
LLKDHLTLGGNEVLPPGTFSGGGAYVVALTEGRFGNPTATPGISVVNLHTGRGTALGTGAFAAGDPQRPGAFVTVAAPVQATASENLAAADSELELVDAGRPRVALASGASLDADLGLGRSTPVSFVAVPNPSGSLVAVEVENLLEAQGSEAGLVVLDRSGKPVAVRSPALGPASGALPAWSPSGTALSYLNEGPMGYSIVIWDVGSGAVTVPLRAGVGVAEQCLWSPSGAAVLCDSPNSTQGHIDQTWSLTGPGGGPSVSLAGPGFAVDWARG